MLFDSILQYIINCTVVLLVAELDELLFISLAKSDLTPNDSDENGHGDGMSDDREGGHGHGYGHRDRDRDRDTLIEEGRNELGTETIISPPSSSSSPLLFPVYDRSNTLTSRHHEDRVHHMINDFTQLHLSPKEQEAFNCWDFYIVRFNFLSMIIPLMHGKLTGFGCSENSFIRVSEIGMLCLMISRVLINVQVDMLIDKRFTVTASGLRKVVWSSLEHGVPAYLYLLLMYMVFVQRLKGSPPVEND